MRELSDLISLQVISTSEGKKLGSVADAYVDLAAGELVCVSLAKTPELRVILAEDINVIGDDALMVSDRDRLRAREDVEDELERGKRVLSNPPTVMTSQGKTLGQLGVVQIDEGTKKIIRFEVTGGPLKDMTEGALNLPVLEGIVHGQDTLIVPHDIVARRVQQGGGLRGALRTLGERLKVSVEDIGERSEELVRDSEKKLRERAEQARKKADEAAEKAREAVSDAAEDAKKAAGQAKEAAGEMAEKAQETADEVAEEAKDVIEGDEEHVPEAPDAEPDAPRMEDPEGEMEDAVEPSDECEETETHLVPEAATPLPQGEEPAEEDEETEAEDTADDQSSDDEGEETQ
jgi:uncharacterized protein YrrD